MCSRAIASFQYDDLLGLGGSRHVHSRLPWHRKGSATHVSVEGQSSSSANSAARPSDAAVRLSLRHLSNGRSRGELRVFATTASLSTQSSRPLRPPGDDSLPSRYHGVQKFSQHIHCLFTAGNYLIVCLFASVLVVIWVNCQGSFCALVHKDQLLQVGCFGSLCGTTSFLLCEVPSQAHAKPFPSRRYSRPHTMQKAPRETASFSSSHCGRDAIHGVGTTARRTCG